MRQEYRKELYKKGLNDPNNHDGMVTHIEPDILEYEVKWPYFGHLMQRAVSFEKTLMLKKIEGRKRRGQERMRWLDGITDSMDMGLGEL